MTPTVAVVTDSAASLPAELAAKWSIAVVPLQITVDGDSRPEGTEVSPESVLADLLAGRAVSTSQPSPEAFQQAFEQAAAAGARSVVAVLISGKVSGTVNAAQVAAAAVDIPVTIVDSLTLAMATGYAALAAAGIARAGGTQAEVARAAEQVASGSLCVFTVDTLEYLQKGGRVSPAVAAVGRMLSVRPLLGIVDGEVQVLERVRTTARARQALVARVEAHMATLANPAVAVMTLGAAEYGDDAARSLQTHRPDTAMLVRTPVSAVLAVHTGPGVLAAVSVNLPEGLA